MLSRTSEHALRAILFLARRAPGERVPADAIAAALDAPRNYLAKTLNALAKRGIVSSTRGPAGGFRLEAAPAELTLERVVEAFDDSRPRTVCLLGGMPCSDDDACGAHSRWKEVAAAVRAPLRRTTVADLLSDVGPEPTAVGFAAGAPHRTAVAAARH